MPGVAFSTIYEVAADQFGYFTAAQAREVGVSPMALVMMERRATVERVSRGVYRLSQFPTGPLAEYMEASLWPAGVVGIVSHQSALALYGISDVNPDRVHITVPTSFRTRRQVPRRLHLHHANLPDEDVESFEGIVVTSVRRTLRDCAAANVGAETIERAFLDAERMGLLSSPDVRLLTSELMRS